MLSMFCRFRRQQILQRKRKALLRKLCKLNPKKKKNHNYLVPFRIYTLFLQSNTISLFHRDHHHYLHSKIKNPPLNSKNNPHDQTVTTVGEAKPASSIEIALISLRIHKYSLNKHCNTKTRKVTNHHSQLIGNPKEHVHAKK